MQELLDIPDSPGPLRKLLYHDRELTSPNSSRVNVVGDATLDSVVNQGVLKKSTRAKMDRKRFSALFMWFRHAQVSCSVFHTGKITVTGGKTIVDCLHAMHVVTDVVSESIGRDFQVLSPRCSNIVVNSFVEPVEGSMVQKCNTSKSGRYLDLDKFYERYSHSCSYNPDFFPGLTIGISCPQSTVVVFKSAAFNAMGAGGVDEVERTVALMNKLCMLENKDDSDLSRSVARSRPTGKKNLKGKKRKKDDTS